VLWILPDFCTSGWRSFVSSHTLEFFVNSISVARKILRHVDAPYVKRGRLIYNEEEPFVPPYSEGGEHPFQREWQEAMIPSTCRVTRALALWPHRCERPGAATKRLSRRAAERPLTEAMGPMGPVVRQCRASFLQNTSRHCCKASVWLVPCMTSASALHESSRRTDGAFRADEAQRTIAARAMV
jgi:hypothetical protein